MVQEVNVKRLKMCSVEVIQLVCTKWSLLGGICFRLKKMRKGSE